MNSVIKRNCEDWALELLANFPALEIIGARQVGKSTLAKILTKKLEKPAFNLTLDDPETLNAATTDPRGFLQQLPGGVLLIDEAQRAPELILPLKAEIDANREPGRFILTGSSKLTTSHAATDSLAGRVASLQLHGFSQGELNEHKEDFVTRAAHDDFTNLTLSTVLTRADYVNIIDRGGMPEAYKLSSRLQKTWFDAYVSRITTKDIADIARISQPAGVLTLLRQLAALQGFEVVVGRLANNANLTAGITKRYLDLLESVFLTNRIPPWTPNLLKREIGKPKFLISDPALGLWLTKTSPATLKNLMHGQAFGGILESFVASELLKQQQWSNTGYEINHYRSPDGKEIDLVLELEDGRIIGIEVKAASTVQVKDWRQLAWLRDQLGERFCAGIIFTTDTTPRYIDRNIWSLPVAALWSQ